MNIPIQRQKVHSRIEEIIREHEGHAYDMQKAFQEFTEELIHTAYVWGCSEEAYRQSVMNGPAQ